MITVLNLFLKKRNGLERVFRRFLFVYIVLLKIQYIEFLKFKKGRRLKDDIIPIQ